MFVASGKTSDAAKITIGTQALEASCPSSRTACRWRNARTRLRAGKVVHIGLSNVGFAIPAATSGVSTPGISMSAVRAPWSSSRPAWPAGSPAASTSSSPAPPSPATSASRSTPARPPSSTQVVFGDGTTLALNVAAGPFVRFEGTGIALSIGSQTLSGDIVLEKGTVPGATAGTTVAVTRIAFRNVSAAFGDGVTNVVALSDGLGVFVLQQGGLAGRLSGRGRGHDPGCDTGWHVRPQDQHRHGRRGHHVGELRREPATTTALALGDVNGDNRADLLVGTGNQGVLVFLNDGSGDPFDSIASYAVPGTGTGGAVKALALADLDKDGDLDLLIGRTGANELWLGDGTGGFTQLSSPGLGTGATGVAVGDVDKDGWLDVVLGGTSNQYLRNSGNDSTTGAWKKFAAAAAAPGGPSVGVALADVDGDGKIDLVTTASSGTSLYLGTGSGFATAATSIDAAGDPATPAGAAVALVDVTGDGLADLVLATSSGRVVRVNLGQVNQTWKGFATATTAAGVLSLLALGDLTNDGRADLVSSTGTGQPTWAAGDGTGFGTAAKVSAVDLDVPAAPYLAFSGSHVVLTVGDQVLNIDSLTFEQVSDARATRPHGDPDRRPPPARRSRIHRRVRHHDRDPDRRRGRAHGQPRHGPDARHRIERPEAHRLGVAADQHHADAHHRGRHRPPGRAVLPAPGQRPQGRLRQRRRRSRARGLVLDRAGQEQPRWHTHSPRCVRGELQAVRHRRRRRRTAHRRLRGAGGAPDRRCGTGQRDGQPGRAAAEWRHRERQLLAQLDTSTTPVHETVTVGGTAIALDLPLGPFLQVAARRQRPGGASPAAT